MPSKDPEARRRAGEKYRQTDKGRANAIERQKRYGNTPKGRLASRRGNYVRDERVMANANAWVEQLKERAAKARAEHPESFEMFDDDPGEANSTVRFQNHRANKEGVGGLGLTGKQWIAILEGQFYRCFYCHALVPLEIEHYDPISRGGIHDVSNIVAACKSCNSSKKETHHLVWLAKRASQNRTVGAST